MEAQIAHEDLERAAEEFKRIGAERVMVPLEGWGQPDLENPPEGVHGRAEIELSGN
jgi:hypothetical protein